jgi:formylmethanofuran dehydrogenase subunit B
VIFAVDSSKAKQGKYIPGTEILINAPEVLEKMDVDAVLILAWNFADEIIEIVKSICKKLPLVLIPIPEFKVIEL